MSFFHTKTGTTYDELPAGVDVAEFQDIGQRPSDWHYWDNATGAWKEDVDGKLAAAARGW
jgi:hypothetical protein